MTNRVGHNNPVFSVQSGFVEKLASPTVTNSCKAKIPACRSLIYSHKAEIKLKKKVLQVMLCLGALGLGTHAMGAGVRGLIFL